ncbi:MAG: cobalt ECF transporter T component CbiQ [Desulfomonilaceae bacterium]
MDIEEFSLGDSWVHHADPRVKILATLIFAVVVALNHSLLASTLALTFPIVLVIAARLDLKKVLVRLALVNGFVVFLWFFLPFTFPGEIVWSLGPLDIHREGILYSLLITLKSNAIVLMVIALLGTSPVFNLVHALSHMWVPGKIVHLFFFCFRYIHVIHEEYHRLVNAMKVRGFKPGTNMHTYRTHAYLVGMLLVMSFDRSKRILAAMKCRGFKGKFYILHDYGMKKADYVLGTVTILFSLTLMVLK